jgi:hypothetical protein
VVQPVANDAASSMPAYTAPTRVEARYVAPAAPRRERGVIEAGLLAMTLPMAFTVGIMLAPVVVPMMWLFGSRSRQ